jgi:hypothetical protein
VDVPVAIGIDIVPREMRLHRAAFQAARRPSLPRRSSRRRRRRLSASCFTSQSGETSVSASVKASQRAPAGDEQLRTAGPCDADVAGIERDARPPGYCATTASVESLQLSSTTATPTGSPSSAGCAAARSTAWSAAPMRSASLCAGMTTPITGCPRVRPPSGCRVSRPAARSRPLHASASRASPSAASAPCTSFVDRLRCAKSGRQSQATSVPSASSVSSQHRARRCMSLRSRK